MCRVPAGVIDGQTDDSDACGSAGGPDLDGDSDEFRNWCSAVAPDGRVYYFHRITRSVRWDMPDRATAVKMEARISEVASES